MSTDMVTDPPAEPGAASDVELEAAARGPV
jgi:hypothetical protein